LTVALTIEPHYLSADQPKLTESGLSPGPEPCERKERMKETPVIILSKIPTLMLMGLSYIILHRSLKSWSR
jgi:hypothetical protein